MRGEVVRGKECVAAHHMQRPHRLLCAVLAATLVMVSVSAGGASRQLVLGIAEADDSETQVNIPDAALRKALEDKLEKGSGEPITRADMEGLHTFLQADGVGRLDGIEYAVNLVTLLVQSGSVSDLAPLGSLESLAELYLFNNAITDVSALGIARVADNARSVQQRDHGRGTAIAERRPWPWRQRLLDRKLAKLRVCQNAYSKVAAKRRGCVVRPHPLSSRWCGGRGDSGPGASWAHRGMAGQRGWVADHRRGVVANLSAKRIES